MARQSEPTMHDVTDKEIHTPEGVDPYPVPKGTETVGRDEGDLQDPAQTTPDAPHDRGANDAGEYQSGDEAMRDKLQREGDVEAWKDGKTQGAPKVKP